MQDPDRKAALAHVLWIGGPPDAGKSTIATLLGEEYDLPVYHFDRQEMQHLDRADPARHPTLHAFAARLRELDQPAWLEETWVRATPESLAANTLASWSERLDLAIADLLALPTDRPVIAEGPGFFPEAVLPLLTDPRQAVVLVPSEAFKRASHESRGKSRERYQTSDPARYLHNHVERDLLLAAHYREAARRTGVRLIEVDGSRPATAIAATVAEHFGPLLAGSASGGGMGPGGCNRS